VPCSIARSKDGAVADLLFVAIAMLSTLSEISEFIIVICPSAVACEGALTTGVPPCDSITAEKPLMIVSKYELPSIFTTMANFLPDRGRSSCPELLHPKYNATGKIKTQANAIIRANLL